MKKTIVKISAFILLIAAAAVFGEYLKNNAFPQSGLTICYIDVGQGDAAYINADGYNILIDGGAKTNAEEVTAVLDRYGVKTLDLVIATHSDSDHIGGLAKIVRSYDVQTFATSKTDENLKDSNDIVWMDLLSALNTTGVTYMTSGDRYTFGKYTLDVISPDGELGSANDDSVVAMLTYGARKFLFTGDASEKAEKIILERGEDVSADVLKVSHHGSRSATGKNFLKAVNPDYAVVSVSAHNSYNLPNHEVMQRLYDSGCRVYRTDEYGTVTVHCDGENIVVSTEK